MKTTSTFILAIALPACNDQPQTYDEQSDRQAIMVTINAVEEANNAGDVEAWVRTFDDEFAYLPSFSPAVTKREGLEEMARTGFTTWDRDISIIPQQIQIGQEWEFAYSQVRGIVVSRSGPDTVTVDVKLLVVYHRTLDGWEFHK